MSLVLEETTRSVSVFFPPSSSPARYRGVPIGQDYDGGVFHFDPFLLYEDQLVTNPNVVVVGEIGRGKSAMIKTLLYREHLLGRDFFVIDPKGEYQKLAEATRTRVVKLSRTSPIGLNPFPAFDNEMSPSANLSRLLASAYGLIEAVLGRRLEPQERFVYDLAIKESLTNRSTLNLSDLHLALCAGSISDNGGDRFLAAGLASEVSRLLTGDLSGIVGGSGISLFDSPSVVVDLSSLIGTVGFAITVNLLMAHRQNFLHAGRARGSFLVIDEAWALLNSKTQVEWFLSLWKLSRSYGIANIAIQHRLSDLYYDRALGLALDSETFVVYSQPSSESKVACDFMAIPDHLAKSMVRLARGTAIWKVGRRVSLVSHKLHRLERPICDTDQALAGERRSTKQVPARSKVINDSGHREPNSRSEDRSK